MAAGTCDQSLVWNQPWAPAGLIYDVAGFCDMQQHGVLKKPLYPHLSPLLCWFRLPFISCCLIFRSQSLISVSIPHRISASHTPNIHTDTLPHPHTVMQVHAQQSRLTWQVCSDIWYIKLLARKNKVTHRRIQPNCIHMNTHWTKMFTFLWVFYLYFRLVYHICIYIV